MRRGHRMTPFTAPETRLPSSLGDRVWRSDRRRRRRGGCSRQRLAHIGHALPNRGDRIVQTMDLFGEGFERNDAVVAVRVKLAELVDVPEAILRPDEHAMAIQHICETYRGVFQP